MKLRLIRFSALCVVVAGVAGVFASSALANPLTISGSMEGSIKISPGDWISAGYEFTMPGNHAAATVQLAGAQVTISGPCTNGGDATVTIPLAAGPYSDPANSSSWYPSGDENSPSSLQGAVQAPADLCGGTGQLDASAGAIFIADLQSTDTTDPIHLAFHYRDPNAKGKGNIDCYALTQSQWDAAACGASWSSTSSYYADVIVPLFTVGGFLLAAILGGVLFMRQRHLKQRLAAKPS